MRIRQQKAIKVLAWLSLLLAISIVASGFLVPIERTHQVHIPGLVDQVDKPQTNAPVVPSYDEFEQVTDRKMQRPLYDPPPPPPEPEPEIAIVPPPSVSLVMIITGDENRAMFRDARGSLMYKTKGETVSDERSTAEVVEINKDHVVLKHNEELIRVTLNSST